MMEHNAFGQPIGASLNGWTERPFPPLTPMRGRYCSLEPLNAERHAADLFAAYAEAPDGRDWTYMFVGPFASLSDYTGICAPKPSSAILSTTRSSTAARQTGREPRR